jgi:hypothetical protein
MGGTEIRQSLGQAQKLTSIDASGMARDRALGIRKVGVTLA